MAELDSLLEQTATLESLLPQESEGKKPLANKATNLSTSAQVALMSDEEAEVEPSFRQTYQELETGAAPTSTSDMLKKANERNFAGAKSALIDILADPDISDEEKMQASSGLMNIESEGKDLSTILAYRSLENEESDGNGETEFTRVALADAIEDVQSYNKEAQRVLNETKMGSSHGAAEFMLDFATLVTPFAEARMMTGIANDLRDGKDGALNEAIFTLGSLKTDLKEMVTKLPPNERQGFTRKLLEVVRDNSQILPFSTNDYAKIEAMRTFVEDGYYEDGSKWLDNAVSIMDVVGLGFLLKKPLKAAAKGSTKAIRGSVSSARDAVRRSFGSDVQPASASQTVKDTNRKQAEAMHEMAMADETGEVAEATYGASREQVAKHDLGPEIATESGAVKAKVTNIDRIYKNRTEDMDEIFTYVEDDGAIYYKDADKVAMRARVVNDMEQVQGMTARPAMNQVEETANGVNVKAVYGPTKSGYSDPQDAIDMALWSLRHYDIDEKDVTLLVREGGEYVPTTAKEIREGGVVSELAEKLKKAKGPKANKNREAARKAGLFKKRQPDYLIQVNHKYKFNPNDIEKLAEADVKWNIFDRFPIFKGVFKSGSLQQHMMDASSNLDSTIVLSGNRAADKSAELDRKLLKMADKYSKKVGELDEGRAGVLEELQKRANHDGIEYSDTQMKAMGLTPDEVDAMKQWRNYWDTVYWIENRDAAKTLNKQGYKEFIDVATGTKLNVREIKRGRLGKGPVKVYDPETDTIVTKSPEEVDELYSRGGTFAQTRRPTILGDDHANFVMVENSPGKSYTKGISSKSQVLDYRKGYFSVKYKDPYFVEEVIKDSMGNTISSRAVASAGSRKDAELLARRKASVEEGTNSVFIARQDKKNMSMDGDYYWDLQEAKGRSSQRIRGKRLEGSTSNVDDMSTAPILSPVDSMVLSARSISNRVSMRDMIEVSKKRFLQQFEVFLPLDPITKKPRMPVDVRELKYQGRVKENPKGLADARTTYNHLRYLEDGYINQLDDGYKAVLRELSNLAGHAGSTKIEKAALWASNKRGPAAMSKNIAFQSYLATNPTRQMIVQSHQAVQLAANFPRWVVSQRGPMEVIQMTAIQLGAKPNKTIMKNLGMTEAETKKMFKDWIDSGLSASVDKQNLVRGALEDLTDEVVRREIKPLTALRKIGFDAGENLNMMTAWLAHRDEALRAGKDINNLEVLDTIAGKARNYTYNMNSAGDMPYNQNMLGTIFQFMQVPHKALLTMTFNRSLTPMQKARLFGFNAVMYGLPAQQATSLFSKMGVLPEEEGFARDTMVNGLEGAIFNKLLSMSMDERVRVNWDGLAPLDVIGSAEFIKSLWTTDLVTLYADSPSGQLFMGSNPRITNFAKSAASQFAYIPGVEGTPAEFSVLAKDLLSISSGFSNMFKGRFMQEYGKKINARGDVVDENVTSVEAMMQIAGFSPQDESDYYYVSQKTYEESKEYEEDVLKVYEEQRRRSVAKNVLPGEVEYYNRMMQLPWMVFGNDNFRARKIIERELRRDMDKGDVRMINNVLDMHDIMSNEELKSTVDALPDVPQDMKDKYKRVLDDINDYKDKFDG